MSGFARGISIGTALMGVAAICAATMASSSQDRPLAVSPGNGAGTIISSACPTFSWGAVPGAQSYELVTYEVPEGLSSKASPGGLRKLWRVTVPGTARSWTPATHQCLSHGGSYAWAVRAVVNGQPGAWSEANLFKIEKAPSAEEVRGMMAEMRSYLLDSHSPRHGVSGAAPRNKGSEKTRSQARGSSVAPSVAGTRESERVRMDGGISPELRSVASATLAPSLGTPSLSVDGNIALGPSSNIFKDGLAFLWSGSTNNMALGEFALEDLSSGSGDNTAIGTASLSLETVGYSNTALGYSALKGNLVGHLTGSFNTAAGALALDHVSTGSKNSALGYFALGEDTTGTENTALGSQALAANTVGANNIAIGYRAGYNAGTSTGNDNIFIGSGGYSGDSGVIRIGTSNDTQTFITGIHGTTTGVDNAVTVVVDSHAQLGTVSSSRRFKQDIEDMGDVTDKLYELRPVTFRYKKYVKEAIARGRDPKTLPRTYGLIAEEVAKVYPHLVVYDKEGRPETVLYRLLAPMLLNELQKEHWTVIEQASEIAREQATDEAQQAELDALEKHDRSLETQVAALKSEMSKIGTYRAEETNPRSKLPERAAESDGRKVPR